MRTCLTQVGEHPPALFGGSGYSPIYARRRPPVIDLRHLTDGEDQVGITPQEQLLQATHLPPAPLLRRAKDSLLEPLHRVVGGGPVDAGPAACLIALDRGRVRQRVYLLVQSCRFGPVCFTSATASEKSAPFQVGYFHALMALSGLLRTPLGGAGGAAWTEMPSSSGRAAPRPCRRWCAARAQPARCRRCRRRRGRSRPGSLDAVAARCSRSRRCDPSSCRRTGQRCPVALTIDPRDTLLRWGECLQQPHSHLRRLPCLLLSYSATSTGAQPGEKRMIAGQSSAPPSGPAG